MNQINKSQENPAVQESSCRDPKATPMPAENPLGILVVNEQSVLQVQEERLQSVARSVLADSSYTDGMISIAVVDDTMIQQLNRQFLEHDYPTDVLSFLLEDRCPYLEGEVVVSGHTAAAQAALCGWPGEDELLLYVIHGCLHLVGYRDQDPVDRASMVAAELAQLHKLDIALPKDTARWLDPIEERP